MRHRTWYQCIPFAPCVTVLVAPSHSAGLIPLSCLSSLIIIFLNAQSIAAAPRNLTQSIPGVATSPSVSAIGTHRWIAWLDYVYLPATGAESVAIKAEHLNGTTSVEGVLTVATGTVLSPVVTAADAHTAWFFWVEMGPKGGTLKARQRADGAWASGPIEVSSMRAAYPAAHVDGSGRPWVAFEAHLGAESAIHVSHWTGGAFSKPERLSRDGANAYAPAIELDAENAMWVAWHAYVNSTYDIFVRRSVSGVWQPRWQVTDADGDFTGFHVNASLHKGCCGVMWVGWVAKGLHKRAPATPPHLYGWVQHRRLQVRRMQPDGTRDPVHQVPVPFSSLAPPSEEDWRAGPESLVLVNARSKIGVVYRVVTGPSATYRKFTWSTFVQYMSTSTEKWSPPIDVGQGTSSAGYMHPAAATQTDDGLLFVWQRDSRSEDKLPAEYTEPESDIFYNEILDGQLPAASLSGQNPRDFTAPLRFDQPRANVTLQHLGVDFTLLRGDLHAHSEYSHDGNTTDDLMQENYRRARDVAALDFFVLTDHDHHMTHHDWYRQRFACGMNDGAAGLTVLLGVEHTDGNNGHQNVVYRGCDGEIVSHTKYATPVKLFAQLTAGEAIAIPHHPAFHREWAWWDMRLFDGQFDRLYEIYQVRGSFECYQCRGTFREPYKPDPTQADPFLSIPADSSEGLGYFQHALAMGHRIGAIASPDHGGTWGVANVWAASRNQTDVFDGLWERQTFGVSNAIARMSLDFRADGRMMGEEYLLSDDACPIFYVDVRTDYVHPVDGPATIEQIKIYRIESSAVGENGQIFEMEPDASRTTFTFYDETCPRTDSAAYYLRAIQSDVAGVDVPNRPSIGWTSPIFIDWTTTTKSRDAALALTSMPESVERATSVPVTVTVHNEGDIPWTGFEDYGLTVSSEELDVSAVLSLEPGEYVLPGGSLEFQTTLDLDVTPGSYAVTWQMTCPAGHFGTPLTAVIDVLEEGDCVDSDGDGYGSPASETCTHSELDCDDADEGIHPGAAERCNGLDDDCDGATETRAEVDCGSPGTVNAALEGGCSGVGRARPVSPLAWLVVVVLAAPILRRRRLA